jgi:Flp pilus assembly protein TadG
MNMFRRGRAGEEGQALVLMAITMMAMMFAIGLAIDAGTLFVAKRTMQEAADSAAFAGGVVLWQDATKVTEAKAAAVADATLNGYTNTPAGTVAPYCTTCVTVNSPPAAGTAFGGNPLYVEVIIVQQVKTALVPAEAAFNPVRARGVGGADPSISPYAVVLLKTTGPCITMSSGGGLVVPNPDANTGGQVYANCTGTSITSSGGGVVNDALGVTTVGTEPASTVTGPLTTGAAVLKDPFAGFPKPTISNIVSNGPGAYSVPASACNSATPLTPGTYIGGIKNDQDCSGSGGKVYLGNGVFILKGGGFNQNANGGTVATVAGGAMVFNTHSNYPGAKGSGTCGGITAQQGGGFSLTGMSTGTYKGMAYYQDINCTNTIDIQSNGAYLFYGTVYAPSATVSIQSSANMTVDAQLVVSQITFSGGSNVNLTINYHRQSSALTGLPTLVE